MVITISDLNTHYKGGRPVCKYDLDNERGWLDLWVDDLDWTLFPLELGEPYGVLWAVVPVDLFMSASKTRLAIRQTPMRHSMWLSFATFQKVSVLEISSM